MSKNLVSKEAQQFFSGLRCYPSRIVRSSNMQWMRCACRCTRAGDITTSVARVDKARDMLGWTSGHTLDDICQSSWNWQSRNPEGYGVDEA
jgi:UDP-glucose 4-epimerase